MSNTTARVKYIESLIYFTVKKNKKYIQLVKKSYK